MQGCISQLSNKNTTCCKDYIQYCTLSKWTVLRENSNCMASPTIGTEIL
jgi:hypothetical protein